MTSNEFISGIFTGILTSLLFNPIDKIIFTCCLGNKSFFDLNIWRNLYQGSLNTVATRIITSGLYFSYLDHYSNVTDNKFNVAVITALVCSITSPLQMVKYHQWHIQTSQFETFKMIYISKGFVGFGRGAIPLILRDIVFNTIYLNYKEKDNHTKNLLVITTGIVAASPFNLVKNKKYATNENLKEIIKNFKFSQLGLGMSITRSCLSFYSGQLIYDNFKKYLI
jgi:hypothetical protein